MNGENGRSDWDDDRIEAAYRRMVGNRRAPELMRPVMAEVARDGRRAGGRRRLFGFSRAVVGLAAAVVVVCLVGAAFVYRGSQTTGGPTPVGSTVTGPTPTGSLPGATASSVVSAVPTGSTASPQASASGSTSQVLQVWTVSEFLASSGGTKPENTDLFAVKGWLSAQLLVPVCTPSPEGMLGNGCNGNAWPLTETADSTSPELEVVVMNGTSLPDALTNRTSWPVQAVVVGHVRDPRASLCSTAAIDECGAAFVLDQIASLDGEALGPSVAVVNGKYEPKPNMSPAQVSAALAPVLQSGSQIVSMTAVALEDAVMSYSPGPTGLVPSGGGSEVLWYVRIAGPPPLSPPMPGSSAGSGILVVSDGWGIALASGTLLGGAGWGWDPSAAGMALPDGTVTLHTTNFLGPGACGGVGLEAVLRGSRDDPRLVWLEITSALPTAPDATPGPPQTIVWPAGYRARFTPNLEILDAGGNVVLRDGDAIGGVCYVDPDVNTYYLEPPFK